MIFELGLQKVRHQVVLQHTGRAQIARGDASRIEWYYPKRRFLGKV